MISLKLKLRKMDNLINHKLFRFIFLLLLFHFFKEEEIINNPLIISDHPNPLILTYNDKYAILTSGQSVIVNKETGNIESNYNFCEYSFPYVLGSTESGQKFIYSSKKFCEFTLPNIFQNYTYNSLTYSDNRKYIGYIQESEYKGNANKYRKCRCEMKKDEVVIYGKKGNSKMIFTYVYKLLKSVEVETYCSDLEDKIICKKLLNSYYSCAGICNGQVALHIFSYITKSSGTTTNCEMIFQTNIKLLKLSSHTNIEVYETTEDTINIICAQNINSIKFECIRIEYFVKETISSLQCNYEIGGNTTLLFSFPLEKGIINQNCDYTSFGSEYLFCCGGTNFINCERLDNKWKSLNAFNLDLQGENNNIKILTSSSSFVSIFYMNENLIKRVCDYIIHIPTCVHKQYTIISFHSINGDKSENNKNK